MEMKGTFSPKIRLRIVDEMTFVKETWVQLYKYAVKTRTCFFEINSWIKSSSSVKGFSYELRFADENFRFARTK